MSDVLGQSAAINYDVIKKDKDKFVQPRSQCAIHRPLKGTWCPGQSKSHNTELIVPQVGLECCLVLVSRLQQNLVEFGSQIKFGEPTGMSQFIQELINDRNRILGLNSHRV